MPAFDATPLGLKIKAKTQDEEDSIFRIYSL